MTDTEDVLKNQHLYEVSSTANPPHHKIPLGEVNHRNLLDPFPSERSFSERTFSNSSDSSHTHFDIMPSSNLSNASSGDTSNTNSPSPHSARAPQAFSDARYERQQTSPMLDKYGGLLMSHTNEVIDYSRQHDSEKVVELSPNGRYARLNTVLGKGAYKSVYKAIDREEGYEVAWNVLQTTRAEYKELGHEIEILKSVRHPNIITFHDAWYNDNEFVFITELMTSGTLREYIRKLSLPNTKIIKRWCRQILKGLVYLHSHNPPIIHRDIKGDNIFINGAHGEVKIGDMGTAEMKMGKKYTVIGTPEFMAPEMYEEKGYNEKVDIYAFGMCLLEMVTGEYPYSECKNAAQVYKKVTQGVKPECLSKVQDPEILSLINACLLEENDRISSEDILEHSFLAVEPEVVFLASDPTRKHLALQLVFKGFNKRAVKFDFNVDTDTAEDVVSEMIDEQVLDEKYQHLITGEINRILRDIQKNPDSSHNREEDRMIWRRENDIRSELGRAKQELSMTKEKALEADKRVELMEQRLRGTEERYEKQLLHLKEEREREKQHYSDLEQFPLSDAQQYPLTHASSTHSSPSRHLSTIFHPSENSDRERMEVTGQSPKPSVSTPPPTIGIPGLVSNSDKETIFSFDADHSLTRNNSLGGLEAKEYQHDLSELFQSQAHLMKTLLAEYSNDTAIEDFVRDAASANNRTPEKALEWAKKLEAQDILTVGDLRDLHEEDWSAIGLTVFALRVLKNALCRKRAAAAQKSPKITSTTGFAISPLDEEMNPL